MLKSFQKVGLYYNSPTFWNDFTLYCIFVCHPQIEIDVEIIVKNLSKA